MSGSWYIEEFINYTKKPEWIWWIIFSVLTVILFRAKKFLINFFFRTLRRIDNLIKYIATKDLWYWNINIISDTETYFIKYEKQGNWPKLNLAKGHAKIAKYSEIEDNARKKYEKYEELKWSKRIAHHEIITNEEATHWWYYFFERKFSLNFDISRIKKAYLYIIVDDECEITINESDLAENINWEKKKITSNEALATLDIKDYLKKGDNLIKLKIRNISFETRTDNLFVNSTEKWKQNPYWVKYWIWIKYIK